jgi:CDP-paratose 2-epimerase
VGSNLAIYLKNKNPNFEIVGLDNLKRRGSEFNIKRFRDNNIAFVHGDVRSLEDIESIGQYDLLLECSAEPSVHAGYGSSPNYLINTNLQGTINCLETARKYKSKVIFLSTSRVYPIEALRNLPLKEFENRLDIPKDASGLGWSHEGIAEDFPLTNMRSLYGATKLCSELILEEYSYAYEIPYIINRCGVIAGPWQMGKVDQGFMTLWTAKHIFKSDTLKYMGFGGKGLQIRDVLNVFDLCDLVQLQIENFDKLNRSIFNAGGGASNSVSLCELTTKCQKITGESLKIGSVPETNSFDIPYYVTDNKKIESTLKWKPIRTVDDTIVQIKDWILENYEELKPILS